MNQGRLISVRMLLIVMGLFFLLPSFAASKVNVDAFLSTECPHCSHANEFLTKFQSTHNWLEVNRFYIDKDKKALVLFSDALNKSGTVADFAVPSLFFCGVRWVGFDLANKLAKPLEKALNYCHDHQDNTGNVADSDLIILRTLLPDSASKDSFSAMTSIMLDVGVFTLFVLIILLWMRKKGLFGKRRK